MNDRDIIVQRLKDGEQNFHHVNLAGFDLSGMNLKNIDFGNSDLRNTNFNRCTLHNANFSRANLENSTFFDALLINANFSEANLSRANMGYADLRGATFARAIVVDLNMAKADIRGTDLRVHNGEFQLSGPWNSMTLSGAIFNSSTKTQQKLTKYGAIREFFLPIMVLKQGFYTDLSLNRSEQTIYTKAADIWITGSFYLLSLIVIIAFFGVISQAIPWYTLVSIFIAGILVLVIIGAFILRHVNDLDQKNFAELIVEVLKKLPVLGSTK